MEAECDAPLDFSKLNALGDMDMEQMHEFWDEEMEYWKKRRRDQNYRVCSSNSSNKQHISFSTQRHSLTMRLLLLLAEQSEKRGLGHAHHLETDSRNITHSVTRTTETSNQHFVVFIHVVQTTITRHEGSDLLAVLDELHTDALTNGGVGLLGLHTAMI